MPSLRRKRFASTARIGLACAALCVIALDSRSVRAQAPRPAVPPAAAPAAAPGAVPAAAPPGAAAPGGVPGGYYFRWGFLSLDELSFTSHPFFQITDNSGFNNAKGATGTSFNFGAYESDAHGPDLLQWLHSLPPFYIETGRPVDLFLPKAVTFGFDSYEFSQTGKDATGSKSLPPIKMDMWLYLAGIRGYAFDPTQPGINFYIGLGFGFLQGNLTAQSAADLSNSVIGFSLFPTGSTMFGIDIKGDNFGVRYEVNLFNAKQVSLASNPYAGPAPTKIDFSGSLVRLALFYEF